MASKKKGKKKSYSPRPAPKGYKPRPNDGIVDYRQTVRRSSIPRTRTRNIKADGYDTQVILKPSKRKKKD